MRKFRLKSLEYFRARPLPEWGGDLSEIDFENIFYYIRPTEKQANSWEDLPPDIKDTWDKLGIPEAEKKYLAGVGAQYESEVVYHKLQEDLESQGVIFLDMDSGLREHEELVKQYFGTVIPQNDNKFAALNSAVWSGGSFIYVPPGVKVEMPLQAYFRINAENMPLPPTRTWCATVEASGLSSSRFGPICPFASAASSVWQLPQPALAKTLPPGELAPPPPPPQPAASGIERNRRAVVARSFMTRCLGTIAPWP